MILVSDYQTVFETVCNGHLQLQKHCFKHFQIVFDTILAATNREHGCGARYASNKVDGIDLDGDSGKRCKAAAEQLLQLFNKIKLVSQRLLRDLRKPIP